ncbi:MAG: hypothetical protein WA477_19090 [Candidatus Sulfotelmatobacter sp.]
MKRTSLPVICLCAALVLAFAPFAKADQSNQATKVTFSQSVEIPGRVLSAGTYWFTLVRDDPDRNVVQVWNSDRQHLLATILTVPDERMHAPGHTVVKFEERASNQPQALRAWFYPGDNYGHEFVYSESRARELAKRTGHPVLSMRDEDAANITKPAKSAKEPSIVAMKQAHVEAISPSGQEVDKSQAIQAMSQSSSPMSTPQR